MTLVKNTERQQARVYASLNKPLTLCGVERRLFFLALIIGAGTFNFFGSLLGGLIMSGTLYALARWATAIDPDLFRIILAAARSHRFYDPLKREGHLEQGRR